MPEDKTQHSSQFTEEMRQRLLTEQAKLEKELSSISHVEHGDAKANYPEYGRHEDENAAEMADFEVRAGTTDAVEIRLDNVSMALKRIEEGSYGLTQDGKTIPEERLRANPAATTLIDK
jgi:DnaK suppressor protein